MAFSSETENASTSSCNESGIADSFESDLGEWLGKSALMTSNEKREMLRSCWKPPEGYNFRQDAIDPKRCFINNWLQIYAPWLVYSPKMKGALCLYCVLFPPTIVQGVLGAFIKTPFVRYKQMHEACKNHASSRWHMDSMSVAKDFMENVPVDVIMVSGHKKIIEKNRNIVSSIISTIIFCGTHDLSLRGKHSDSGKSLNSIFHYCYCIVCYFLGNFIDLLEFKMESGDKILQDHIENGQKNASYTSARIQNEIIELSGATIKDMIIEDAKLAAAYSILADETADIAGKEQLSIGIRFFDEKRNVIREEFLGFVELKAMDAKTISSAIDQFIQNCGLDPNKCVGQGYDGCSTMSGKTGGVQNIIRKTYTKALFFHCASHRLNLVVNDLNILPEVRNTIATVKDIINFFRESVSRRKYAPNIPAFCETRWSQKYKSISIFKTNFEMLVNGLDALSKEGNDATRKGAFQLISAATKSMFIICVCVMAKYSALLEPVVNVLQSKSLDLMQCAEHIKRILSVINEHRKNVDSVTNSLVDDAKEIAEKLGIQLNLPRVVGRQQHRSNQPFEKFSEYWKRSIVIPYLDSLTQSLSDRFSDKNSPAFALFTLHPHNMLKSNVEEFQSACKNFSSFYSLDMKSECELWYSLWKKKDLTDKELKELKMIELLKEAETFFPSVKNAIHISLAQPCGTSTIERSFSNLRKVKTWLRSTMGEDRLIGKQIYKLR